MTRRVSTITFAALLTLAQLAIATGAGLTSYAWDFEGGMPPGWTTSGNSLASVVSENGGRALRLAGSSGGCWTTLTHVHTPWEGPVRISFDVKPTNLQANGCHGSSGAAVKMYEGASWTTPGADLFRIDTAGLLGGRDGSWDLGTTTVNAWHHVELLYDRSGPEVRMGYTIDGEPRGEFTGPKVAREDGFAYFTLTPHDHVAYFDNIRIDPVPRAPTLVLEGIIETGGVVKAHLVAGNVPEGATLAVAGAIAGSPLPLRPVALSGCETSCGRTIAWDLAAEGVPRFVEDTVLQLRAELAPSPDLPTLVQETSTPVPLPMLLVGGYLSDIAELGGAAPLDALAGRISEGPGHSLSGPYPTLRVWSPSSLDIISEAAVTGESVLDETLGATYADRIHLVGHSRGGLVIRCMLVDCDRAGMAHAEADERVVSASFIAVPHRGAAKAALFSQFGGADVCTELHPTTPFAYERVQMTGAGQDVPSASPEMTMSPFLLGLQLSHDMSGPIRYLNLRHEGAQAIETVARMTLPPNDGIWFARGTADGDGTVTTASSALDHENVVEVVSSTPVEQPHVALPAQPCVATAILAFVAGADPGPCTDGGEGNSVS